MTDKELHKLKRQDLLQMMLDSGRETEKLRRQMKEAEEELKQSAESYERLKDRLNGKDQQINKLKSRLDDKDRQINKLKGRLDKKDAQINDLRAMLEKKRGLSNLEFGQAGSIAEAAMKINEVFESAQKAADQYLYNVRRVYGGGYDLEASGREAEERVLRQIDAAIAADKREAEEEAAAWAARDAEYARIDAEEAERQEAYAAEAEKQEADAAETAETEGQKAYAVAAERQETYAAEDRRMAAGSAEVAESAAAAMAEPAAEHPADMRIPAEAVPARDGAAASEQANPPAEAVLEEVSEAVSVGKAAQAGRPDMGSPSATENTAAAAKAFAVNHEARQRGVSAHNQASRFSGLKENIDTGQDKDKKRTFTGIELARMAAARRAGESLGARTGTAESKAKPAKAIAKPAVSKPEPPESKAKPAEAIARSAENTPEPPETKAESVEAIAKSAMSTSEPSESKAEPAEAIAKPPVNTPELPETKAKLSNAEAKPASSRARSTSAARASEARTRRGRGGTPSSRQPVAVGISEEEKARRVATIKEEIMRQMNSGAGTAAHQEPGKSADPA